jgi:TRAP-type C4-dicarboxylate transport system permease small subunit
MIHDLLPAAPRVKRLDHALELALYWLSGLLMLALTAAVLWAVAARYFFNAPPSWSEEVPRVIFLWMTYIAIAVAVRRGQSLRITVFLHRFPPLPRLWLEMLMHGSIFVMLAFLFWHNIPVIELNRGSRMLATQWSDAVRYWPLSIGCVLIGLYQLRLVVRSWLDYKGASPA